MDTGARVWKSSLALPLSKLPPPPPSLPLSYLLYWIFRVSRPYTSDHYLISFDAPARYFHPRHTLSPFSLPPFAHLLGSGVYMDTDFMAMKPLAPMLTKLSEGYDIGAFRSAWQTTHTRCKHARTHARTRTVFAAFMYAGVCR